jgi:hypothetical protein
VPKYFIFSVLELNTTIRLEIVSLKEKFSAYVGKYLIILAKLPRQREAKPSSFMHLLKQSEIPTYCLLRRAFSFCVCKSSLTRSIGAAQVLAMIPEMPPPKKSMRKSMLEWEF